MPAHLPRPTLVVDTREQRPLKFERLESIRATLQTGDYSIQGHEDTFTVERKTLSDLVASVTVHRDRFTRELERMRTMEFRRLLIVGSRAQLLRGDYRSRVHPNAILGTLYAFEVRYGLPFVWSANQVTAARLVERWAFYFVRERLRTADRQIHYPTFNSYEKEKSDS